jgi:formylmethanofuran dehydrogenase subunit E
MEGTNVCDSCRLDPDRKGMKKAGQEICDHCDEPIADSDLVWLNMIKLHAKCLQGFKAKSNTKMCASCGKVVIGDEKMIYNDETIHPSCLPSFRKAKQQSLMQ